MDRQWKWKSTGVVLLTLLAVAMLVPSWAGVTSEGEANLPKWFSDVFSRKLVLGLDLQGGIHLQYKVDVPEALSRKTGNLAGSLEAALKELGATAKASAPGGATIDDSTTVVVTFEKPEDVGKIDPEFLRRHAPDHVILGTDGPVVTLQMSTDALKSFQQLALEKAIETVERRINEFGVAESSVTRRGDSEIVVQIPGVKESEFATAKEKLSQTGQLRFQIVDRNGWSDFYTKVSARAPKADAWPTELREDLKDHMVSTAGGIRATSRELLEYMVKGQVDEEHLVGYQEYWTSPKDNTLEPIESMTAAQEKLLGKAKFARDAAFVKGYTLKYMFKKAGMSGENVERANVGYDQYNRAEVNMEFSKVDADNFYEMTKTYTQQQMAIMIDDVVFSDPNIKEPIPGGRVRIELGRAFGGQAQKEAAALVAVLKSGALQAPLRKVYDSQIGPTLGADSIKDGKMAVIIGFLGVALFMMIYYRLSGVVANMALAYNIVLTLAMMAAFGATLTLPGIAGIVLGVGMAVDANVLIYERIREELRHGVSVRVGIDRGYSMALSSIVDSNLTTVIAAIVLYQYGSGPVRGFAVTLTIGILASMFTALIFTRLIFEWMYFRGEEPKTMSV